MRWASLGYRIRSRTRNKQQKLLNETSFNPLATLAKEGTEPPLQMAIESHVFAESASARDITGKTLALGDNQAQVASGATAQGPAPQSHQLRQNSPFSLCWKEGENSLAVILAIRASSWAF